LEVFDIIILALFGLSAFKGYSNGFIVELFALLAFFIGLFLALELTIPVSLRFFGDSNYFNVISILVFIGLFVLLSYMIKTGAKLLKKAIDITPLGVLDNIVGAISGVFKSALIISVIIWVCSSVGVDFEKSYAEESLIFPYLVAIGPSIFEAIGYFVPVIKDLIETMDNVPKTKDTPITVLT